MGPNPSHATGCDPLQSPFSSPRLPAFRGNCGSRLKTPQWTAVSQQPYCCLELRGWYLSAPSARAGMQSLAGGAPLAIDNHVRVPRPSPVCGALR
ncbi:hypothetical protein NDU88_004980 [Pleurodeles waltl]|uniref:Uncharacterized protein n=1 Tax=Pleurodeles waltl TaxID=8319 RepID=A0AAV7MXX0_PLEWA|nr:hypothetical protein NDU88_004980 [Pleurodeles waltl]